MSLFALQKNFLTFNLHVEFNYFCVITFSWAIITSVENSLKIESTICYTKRFEFGSKINIFWFDRLPESISNSSVKVLAMYAASVNCLIQKVVKFNDTLCMRKCGCVTYSINQVEIFFLIFSVLFMPHFIILVPKFAVVVRTLFWSTFSSNCVKFSKWGYSEFIYTIWYNPF